MAYSNKKRKDALALPSQHGSSIFHDFLLEPSVAHLPTAYYQSTLLYQALCTCMTEYMGVTAFSCSRMPDSDTSSDRQLDFSLGQISGIQIGTSIMMDNDESMVPRPLVLVSVKRAINQANRRVTGTEVQLTEYPLLIHVIHVFSRTRANGLEWRLQPTGRLGCFTPTQIILFVHHANGLRIEIKKLEWRLKPIPHDLDDQPTRVNLDGCGVLPYLLLRLFLAAHVRSDPMAHPRGPLCFACKALSKKVWPRSDQQLCHTLFVANFRTRPSQRLQPKVSCIILTHLCNQQRIKSIGPSHRLA